MLQHGHVKVSPCELDLDKRQLDRVFKINHICQEVDTSHDCHCQSAIPGTHGVGSLVLTGYIHCSVGLALEHLIELEEGPEDDSCNVEEDRQEGHTCQEGGEVEGHNVGVIPHFHYDGHHG